jgi:hypothetical protein
VAQFDRCRQLLGETGHDALDLPLFGLGQKHTLLSVKLDRLRDRRPQLEAAKRLWPGAAVRLGGVCHLRFFGCNRYTDRDGGRFRLRRFRR